MMVRLEIWTGTTKGKVLEFKDHDVFLFGRSPACHYALPHDPYVSRHHFLLEVNPPTCFVRDLGSLNGIRINGIQYGRRDTDETLPESQLRGIELHLKHRDVIQVGETILRVTVDDNVSCAGCKASFPPESQTKGVWAGELFYCASCSESRLRKEQIRNVRPQALRPEESASLEAETEPVPQGSRGNRAEIPSSQARAAKIERRREPDGQYCSLCGRVVTGGLPYVVDDQPLCSPCCEEALEKASTLPEDPPAPEMILDALPEFPNYEVLRELGRGGMGEVYLGRRKKDGRCVAIKVMLAKRGHVNMRDVKRFFREIEICRQFVHPNIVAFEEQGEVDGKFFFAMEYCPDGNVRELMRKRGGRLSAREGVPLILQALEGLAYAHARDIVHRDLKSENVLLCKRNEILIAKVADFGLAKSFQQAGLSGITLSREAVGTCGFMPREQITDFRNAKPVTDIFSMGATLYHMLTGQYVYDFAGKHDPLQVVLEGGVVPIRDRDPSIDKRLASVVDHAVKPDPQMRYPSATAFKEALSCAMGG